MSALIPSGNGIITTGDTVGDTVTDSTVNVVTDLVTTSGGGLEGLAQNTAANALNQLALGSTLGAASDGLTGAATDAWDSLNLDVLIPSKIWTL